MVGAAAAAPETPGSAFQAMRENRLSSVPARPANARGIAAMIDPWGRRVTYLRVSVTDRCDFRCVYCMAAEMTFLPKADVLTLEELDRLCAAFIARGVRRLRITGGEPLVRRDILVLFERLGRHLDSGALDELTVTTNGSRLALFAAPLHACGVRRINVSLDSLDPDRFRAITRRGRLETVLEGLAAARAAGLQVRINTVALKGINDDEFDTLIGWCGEHGFDLCLIETMPLGAIDEDRIDRYLPLSVVRQRLARRWTLDETGYRTGGPARYVTVAETGRRLGFIMPLTHTFCGSCNRVRVSCTGRLYLCLGHDASADLRTPLRASSSDRVLMAAVDEAIGRKPKGHDFAIDRAGKQTAVARHMSVTGG
jgi:cyclic pyranopterin phosphate synthase